MATVTAPRPPEAIAYQVLDGNAYAEWDGLLDTFDWLRKHMPVALIEAAEPGIFDPFWLVTRYDDVMRISKDNALFLNNPRPVVFTTIDAIAFSRRATGSDMLVDSLVTFDAPIHPKYRRLTQEWFMPRSLRSIEERVRDLARRTVERMIEAGPEIVVDPRHERPEAHGVRARRRLELVEDRAMRQRHAFLQPGCAG